MAEAIKCDLTGKMAQGTGIPYVEVEIRKGLKVRGTVYVERKKGSFVQGRLAPGGAQMMETALSTLKHQVKGGTK